MLGLNTINQSGIEILGYPGLWVNKNSEIRQITKHLK